MKEEIRRQDRENGVYATAGSLALEPTIECLNRISQKALERSLGCFFHAQISAGNAGQPEKLNCVIRPVG